MIEIGKTYSYNNGISVFQVVVTNVSEKRERIEVSTDLSGRSNPFWVYASELTRTINKIERIEPLNSDFNDSEPIFGD